MNVLYCGDKNISDGLIISVLSLLKNVKEPLQVYVLTMRLETRDRTYEALPESLAEFLDCMVKKADKAIFVKLINAGCFFQKEIPSTNLETRVTPCCMLRLYADEITELPDKILYLDNDVVCRLECSDFYHQDMNGCEIAGVLDYYGRFFFRRNIWKMDYVNSGVLLLNLKEIRKTGLFGKCRKRCAEKKMFMPDQSAINKLAEQKKIFPRKYNEQRKLQEDTIFQHFTTSFRFWPWIHTVSVKPWNIEKIHDVLKIHEYDDILEEYRKVKAEYEMRSDIQ